MVYLKAGAGQPALLLDAAEVFVADLKKLLCCIHCAFRHFTDTHRKEAQPFLPIPFRTDLVQEVAIFAASCLKIEAEVEQWIPKHAVRVKQQGDEDSTYPTIAVQKWVNGALLMSMWGFRLSRLLDLKRVAGRKQ